MPFGHHPPHSAPYRPEIDGLRAIAVLSVVLYHFGVPGFDGGFVGVDVFFVISGFLIGGILWREYRETGRIRLVHFYVRRFRRLAPAFFVMALVTTALAWALLMPFEFRDYGKTLIAATVYLSNVLFYRGAGYFDSASEEKPLLHTWSLSVEEQFYIFLPLFLILFGRWRRVPVPLLGLILVLSLAACAWVTRSSPTATFYLFPFRAWELLAGVLLAIWGQETGRSWNRTPMLSLLGIFLIALSVIVIRPNERFPGVVALLPVIGTLLVLANGVGETLVNRVLRMRGPVFFGLISYSLYLWHWPVFTLSSYLRGDTPELAEATLWIALSIALAWLSWRFVEMPVRRANRMPGGVVLGGVVVSSGVLLAAGGWIYKQDGMISRFSAPALPHIQASADFLQDWSRCTVPTEGPLAGLEICPIGPDGDPKVLVWGDSHVRAFKEGLDQAAFEADTPGLIIWRAGCPPFFGLRKIETAATQAQNLACSNANLQIKQSFASLPSVETLLLIGRWAYYAEGTGVGRDAHNIIQVLPAQGAVQITKKQSDTLKAAAEASVSTLLDHFDHVAVLRQAPEVPYYDSRAAAREAAHAHWPLAGRPETQASVAQSEIAARAATGDGVFADMVQAGAITWIDPWPQLCDATECHALHGQSGYYFDNNHVTNTAARALRRIFDPVFQDAHGAAQATDMTQ